MELLQHSNTKAFFYGFTHPFGADIAQIIEPNLHLLDDIQQKFDKDNKKIRLEIERQYQQFEEETKQIKKAKKH